MSSQDNGVTTSEEAMAVEADSPSAANGQTITDSASTGAAPSKKFLKRLEKTRKYTEKKKLKRLIEKQKIKKSREAAKAAGDLKPITRKMLKKTLKPVDYGAETVRVAIDLTFDDKMTLKELTKCSKQMLRIYTLNRRSAVPMPVYFCGIKKGTQFCEVFEKNDGWEHWDVKVTEDSYLQTFPKEKIVYLTSESENILNELSKDDVYVIGGLVDHNRYKGICHELAEKAGVRHARLPIKENVVLKNRTVLTIDQVFDIISRVHCGGDWKTTLMEVLPQRKGAIALPNEEEDENHNSSDQKEVEDQSELSNPPDDNIDKDAIAI